MKLLVRPMTTLFLGLLLGCHVVQCVWYEDVLQLANDTREIGKPAWRYCDGTASVSQEMLYATPTCTVLGTQLPLLNASIIMYDLFPLNNLSFCCKSNYTAVLPRGTDIMAKDEEARFMYQLAIEGTLLRYDCATFYPLRTCAPCAYAYRSWVCAQMFPLACKVAPSTAIVDASVARYQAMPICRDVCLEVIRKCPSTFGFRCPLTTKYTTPLPPDPFSNVTSFAAASCNPMQMTLLPPPVSSTSGATQTNGGRRLLLGAILGVVAISLLCA